MTANRVPLSVTILLAASLSIMAQNQPDKTNSKNDKIPWGNCGGIKLTKAIEHIAITEKMMRNSGLVLSKEKVDLPESSMAAYRLWEGQNKREVDKELPLPIAIRSHGYLPAQIGICNLVPSQT